MKQSLKSVLNLLYWEGSSTVWSTFQKPYTTLRLRMVLQDEILPVNRPRSTTSQMHTSEQCYQNHKCICAARQIHCFKGHTLRYDYAWFFKTKFCLWIDHVVQLPRCTPENSATKITNVYALPGPYIVSKAIHYATITHGSSRRKSACESTM